MEKTDTSVTYRNGGDQRATIGKLLPTGDDRPARGIDTDTDVIYGEGPRGRPTAGLLATVRQEPPRATDAARRLAWSRPDRRRRTREGHGRTHEAKAQAAAPGPGSRSGEPVLDITGRPIALRTIDLDTFFRPERVAVVGASDTNARPNTALTQKITTWAEERGATVYYVNPNRPETSAARPAPRP